MAEPRGLVILLLLSLAKLLVTNAKDANITCLIPDDCILPCSFRPTGTVVIHWYKQQIPVHSYYYNKDQFGLQNKHFSGRTALFNSQIPHGNASLFLKRVKVQDKGRYKCYTSTRKGNQELFVNLDVKAVIQSVTMEMTEERFTCSTHNVYPVPQVTWTTDHPSAIEALQNSTIITTDHKADKTQTWTASWKNQDGITHEEGHALSIPCIAPHALQNFSLIWSFTSSSKPTIILRYDTKKRHIFNLWEDQADLDQEQLLQADASLLLHNPDIEEHSGTYTCTFSDMQSRHVIQTNVNITASIQSVDKQSVQRTRWSTAASAALFLFTIIVALPGCVRRRAVETRNATHRHNGAGMAEVEHHKDLHMSTNTVNQHGSECNSLQMQLGAQDQVVRSTPHTAAVVLPSDTELIQEDKTEDAPVAENDSMEVSSLEEKY